MRQDREIPARRMASLRYWLYRNVKREACFVNRESTSKIRDTRYEIRAQRSGFTVIEILIVVVIIGIAAMMVIPMMTSAASMQIRSAANMIAADLEYAKSMAISRGQDFSVVFNKAEESYRIENQDGDVIAHPVKKGFNYEVNFSTDSRLDKVDIADVDFDTTSKVKFDCLGSPDNGGDITLQAGGVSMTVRVEPVTGFISIAD